MPAYRALEQMKQGRARLVLVVDDTGGIDGLLTATDLVEVLAGHASFVTASPGLRTQRDDGSWLLDGRRVDKLLAFRQTSAPHHD